MVTSVMRGRKKELRRRTAGATYRADAISLAAWKVWLAIPAVVASAPMQQSAAASGAAVSGTIFSYAGHPVTVKDLTLVPSVKARALLRTIAASIRRPTGGAGGTIVTAQVSGNGGGGGASEAPIDAESLYKQVLIHLGPFIAPEISFSHVAGKCSAPDKTKIGWRENPGQAYTHPMIDAVVTTRVGGTVLQAQIFGQPFADIWTDSPSCSIECQTPNFWTTTSPQTGQDQVGIETGLTAGGVIKFDNAGGKSSKNLVTAGNNGKEDQEDNATNSPAITSMSLPPGHWDLSQYPLGADMVVGTLLPGNPLFTPVQDPSFSTPLPPHKLEAVFTWR